MEKNMQLEKIQLEFDLYEGRINGSFENAINEIFLNLEEVDVARSWIEFDKRRNSRRRFISRVLGQHAERFGYLDSWYYDMDDAYLDKKKVILDSYYQQLNSIYGNIDEDNFLDVCKLMAFARHKNNEYIADIQEERTAVKNSTAGDSFEVTKYNQEVFLFSEWFQSAIENVSCVENIEKVKN